MPLRKIRHPAGACTAEEKKESAEMNLTDHAGVRLTHGKPKVNGVEIHYATQSREVKDRAGLSRGYRRSAC